MPPTRTNTHTNTLGQHPPWIHTSVPGAVSTAWVRRLASTECPAFTARRARRSEQSGAPFDPIVWREAVGVNVVDADGNIYVDFTSGFGAASIGHRHPRVVEAIHTQANTLIHALGDVHPSQPKINLLEKLCALGPWPESRAMLSTNGSDAVEAALKTAMLWRGYPGVIAFEHSYHGLAHGPLAACGYQQAFRAPFAAQLNPHVVFTPWPNTHNTHTNALAEIQSLLQRHQHSAHHPRIGAVLIEPILGRGGIQTLPKHFLSGLQQLCHEHHALLIADEIFTGLGRCGAMLQSVTEGAVPDLICLGKALGGGMPISACIGDARVLAKAWGDPDGEALHTGTFFGHPLSAAAALATLDVIDKEQLAQRATTLGQTFRGMLHAALPHHNIHSMHPIHGHGLMLGLALGEPGDPPGAALPVVRALLAHGFITLPCGSDASMLQLTPPLTIAPALLQHFVDVLARVLTSL